MGESGEAEQPADNTNVIPANWGFCDEEKIDEHFRNHWDDKTRGDGGRDFASEEEYGTLATAFFSAPPTNGVLECTRQNGTIVRFCEHTFQFMVIAPQRRCIMTYYYRRGRPSDFNDMRQNRAYYYKNCGR